MSYAGQVVVITGASSGIGRSLAIELAKQQAKVGVIARREELLTELANEVRSAGGTIEAAPADVGDQQQLTAAIQELAEKLGPIDMIIANAGVGYPSMATADHLPNVEKMNRVNFLGVVYSFAAVVDDMRRRRSGHLVAIASLAAYKGLPGSAGYCATKAAVLNYCEAFRIELRNSGVAVTCVCPGFVDTPMVQNNAQQMPLIMPPDRAARKILLALHKRPGVYDFPKRMRLLMWLSKWAPDWLLVKMMPAGSVPSQPGG